MFKKTLIATALIIASSQVAFAYSAPYVGASIGVTANTLVRVKDNNFNISSFRGMPVSLFAGFGAVLSGNFYLAGEVTGTVGTVELNNNGLKTSYGYGASILPGFLLCDHTLSYLRLGILSARFPDVATSSTGGQVGFGLQTSLTQNVDIRGEYGFIAYRKLAGTSASPRSDQFVLSAIYKFD